jgi:hypothetical protein
MAFSAAATFKTSSQIRLLIGTDKCTAIRLQTVKTLDSVPIDLTTWAEITLDIFSPETMSSPTQPTIVASLTKTGGEITVTAAGLVDCIFSSNSMTDICPYAEYGYILYGHETGKEDMVFETGSIQTMPAGS